MALPTDIRIVVAGPVGAGQATAIQHIGEGIAVAVDLPEGAGAIGDMGAITHGAFGLIVLADNRQPDAIAQLEQGLRALAVPIGSRRTVVGVGRLDAHPSPGIDAYCTRLEAAGWAVPVIDVDPRREADVRLLLCVLVSLAEAELSANAV